MTSILKYNERAWAIDLISEINSYCTTRNRAIARAGGEESLKTNKKQTLFPDVIIFGDSDSVRVRHGWELKMPDTPIDDKEFFDNAKEKAVRLGVNSFLLWNVNEAELYINEGDENPLFSLKKSWGPIGINTRMDVKNSKSLWLNLLKEILDDLNDFFESGMLLSSSVEKIFNEKFLANVIEEYAPLAAQSIKIASNSKASKEAEIMLWWKASAVEYGKKSSDQIDFIILSKICITNWLNRFLFCHFLKKFHVVAKDVEKITQSVSIKTAQDTFDKITSNCDFMQVFKPEISSENIGDEVWGSLCEVNEFLTSLKLDSIPQNSLQNVVERALNISRRKFAGQYPTPSLLARLLVSLTMEDRDGTIIDPCCGTGTIPRAAYDIKTEKGISPARAIETIWASDKFQYPLQLCTISLSNPVAMGEVVQIFKSDVFDLKENKTISFTNPNDGSVSKRIIKKFDAITSNLPFVRFEDIKYANTNIPDHADIGISGKSDLFAYIVIALKNLIKDNGHIGIIISNSWLSSEWGNSFREAISEYFHIKIVVTSGAGKWFDNANVVTNIIVLSNKKPAEDDKILFLYTKLPIKDWNNDYIEKVCAEALLCKKSNSNDSATYSIYTNKEIKKLGKCQAGLSSFFSDIKWINEIENSLIKVSNLFDIERGERRGCNALFYPDKNHSLENEFLRPVLKTMRGVKGYIATPDSKAFCCSESIGYLEKNKKYGALKWINKFINEKNDKGVPLTKTLSKADHHWYEMKSSTQADIVLGMNPEDRIFAAKMTERSFVDQRLIRLSKKKKEMDLDLSHALLNSILGIYMIESSGFGRGLGVLDLNPTKLKKNLFMFNPESLTDSSIKNIKSSFSNLLLRDVLPLNDELNSSDRINFDKIVFESFGILPLYQKVKNSLLELYYIRKSTKD